MDGMTFSKVSRSVSLATVLAIVFSLNSAQASTTGAVASYQCPVHSSTYNQQLGTNKLIELTLGRDGQLRVHFILGNQEVILPVVANGSDGRFYGGTQSRKIMGGDGLKRYIEGVVRMQNGEPKSVSLMGHLEIPGSSPDTGSWSGECKKLISIPEDSLLTRVQRLIQSVRQLPSSIREGLDEWKNDRKLDRIEREAREDFQRRQDEYKNQQK